MHKTRYFNQVTKDYTIDQYIHQLVGMDIEEDSLLRCACELVWELPTEGSMPNSLDVALLLSELGADETTLIVALLSSTQLMESSDITHLEKLFGEKIIHLARGVVELHGFRGKRDDQAPEQAERLRRMLLSMVDDVRAVLIKLAFRVQRLRQLKLADDTEQQEIARESLELYAPIANRLGIGQLKWELEDLAFRYMQPETYKHIASNLDEKREEREKFIEDIVERLKTLTGKEGIDAEVYGRPKHIYSIWKKMTSKSRSFDELFDVRAVRVIVETIPECYIVLGMVHGEWRHIDREFDDYIANPKANGYQSLHTAVYGPHAKPVEIQIRTRQMHEFAEHGVAAHWRYKEAGSGKSDLQSGLESLRKLLDSTQTDDEELMENFQTELFRDRVFVLTPEGRVIDLPEGGTPIDFAYAVHTEIGHRTRGAKVNGQIVQLTYPLKSGERVEILTAKDAAPRRDWLISHLGYIKTSRARNRIRSWFRKQDRDKNIQEGRALCERECKRHGVKPEAETIAGHFKLNSPDDLYENLGRGDISVAQVSAMLQDLKTDITEEEKLPLVAEPKKSKNRSGSSINVLGVGNLLTTIASCCMPVPYDDIIGYITKDRGVSVHRVDCKNILHLKEKEQSRLIDVEWGDTDIQSYPVQLMINANDRHGLLSDITRMLSDDKINVIAVNTMSNRNKQTARMYVTVEIRDLQQLSRIMDKISQLRNVIDVTRVATSS